RHPPGIKTVNRQAPIQPVMGCVPTVRTVQSAKPRPCAAREPIVWARRKQNQQQAAHVNQAPAKNSVSAERLYRFVKAYVAHVTRQALVKARLREEPRDCSTWETRKNCNPSVANTARRTAACGPIAQLSQPRMG